MAIRPEQVWGGLLAAGTAYELYGLRGGIEGDTLSEVTRAVFHTDRLAGKVAFAAAYAGFSAWFVPHIVCKASGSEQRAPAWPFRTRS